MVQLDGAAGRIRYIEKKSMTSSGFEPATFRLVAQRLNHLCCRLEEIQFLT
jgi:hypothetical protein